MGKAIHAYFFLHEGSNPVVIGRRAVASQFLGLGLGNGGERPDVGAKVPRTLIILETASPREIERQKAPGLNF